MPQGESYRCFTESTMTGYVKSNYWLCTESRAIWYNYKHQIDTDSGKQIYKGYRYKEHQSVLLEDNRST